ncbi:PAS domain S-box protein [Beijerinckia sp. L45]|uniref:PAS domain S-box protein n=1 Tax=Beijerinckia sp. L45 TaxID=1641855 RepID=UPI00131B1518|nr:PAS domain S-box protein [Beijerinckia sp. L45]
MTTAIDPVLSRDETFRLAALERYDILDTIAETGFDDVVQLASQVCATPVALVSFVAADRQWFKARLGFSACETPLDQSVCSHVLVERGILVIPDLTADARTRSNPLVTGEPHIRFYAGAPIETPDGEILGAVCVIDSVPRPGGLTADQATTLKILARQVMTQMELRRALRKQREDDALHRQIVTSAADYAIITMDREGLVTSWSEGAEQILGWREDEICGKPARLFFTIEDDADGVPEREMKAARETGRGWDERWHRRKDGSVFWANGEMMPLLSDAEEHIGYLKILRDRTQQRIGAEKLEESALQLRSLTEVSPQMVWFGDAQAAITYCNPYWYDYTGLTIGDTSGNGWVSVIRPDFRESVFKTWQQAVATASSYEIEIPFCRASDGAYRWFLARGIPIRNDDGSVRSWIGIAIEIHDRKVAEARLEHLNKTLERQVDERTRERDRAWRLSKDLLVVVEMDGVLTAVNAAVTELLGWEPADLVGHPFKTLAHPDDVDATVAAFKTIFEKPLVEAFDYRLLHKDGTYRWFAWTAAFEDGKVYASGRHTTAEREQVAALRTAEDQLRQAQKMEAVGQLTGGLAHDFNNLLTGITGNLDLLQSKVAKGRISDIDRYITAAQGAAKRAAALTHRLLAFSRRQTLDPKPTDINRLVTEMEEMVRRTVGPSIDIAVVRATDLWTTLVDPNQLENALLNLCINARDAMPDGGRLTIETANVPLEGRAARQRELPPGQYLCLSVADTGTGMTPDVIKRAFDPFFTTKPLGQGTGLGLSMIYGFARQSGGQVRIDSEPGRGTTMLIYLPRHEGHAGEAEERDHPAEASTGERGGTVLVVDDEPSVRTLITEVLEDLGYTAIEAADGLAGLAVLRSDAHVDMLVTDVGLPGGMNGRQLADAGRVVRPTLKVLFITGYAETTVIKNGQLEPGMQILTKPFAMDVLASRIERLIAEETID